MGRRGRRIVEGTISWLDQLKNSLKAQSEKGKEEIQSFS